MVKYGIPSAAVKPSILPPRYRLPELVLPPVLPADAASLSALLHAVIASHNDVNTQALSHMQHMLEQFILARHRLFDEAEILAAGSTVAQDRAPLPSDSESGKGKWIAC